MNICESSSACICSSPLPLAKQTGHTFVHIAFDQPMSGDHELIDTSIAATTDTELLVCGDMSATATQGIARFSLTAFLIEGETSERRNVLDNRALNVCWHDVFFS